jgi:hypothetical protein
LIDGFERTIRILNIDITTEEERVRIFDRSDAAYPVLARTLIARRDNQITTVADLAKRLSVQTASVSAAVSQAASEVSPAPKARALSSHGDYAQPFHRPPETDRDPMVNSRW